MPSGASLTFAPVCLSPNNVGDGCSVNEMNATHSEPMSVQGFLTRFVCLFQSILSTGSLLFILVLEWNI